MSANEYFDDQTRECVKRALQLAEELAHSKAGPIHVLLAIAEQNNADVAGILSSANRDPILLKKKLRDALEGPNFDPIKTGEPPEFSGIIKRAFDDARSIAQKNAGQKITVSDLFLGLIGNRALDSLVDSQLLDIPGLRRSAWQRLGVPDMLEDKLYDWNKVQPKALLDDLRRQLNQAIELLDEANSKLLILDEKLSRQND